MGKKLTENRKKYNKIMTTYGKVMGEEAQLLIRLNHVRSQITRLALELESLEQWNKSPVTPTNTEAEYGNPWTAATGPQLEVEEIECIRRQDKINAIKKLRGRVQFWGGRVFGLKDAINVINDWTRNNFPEYSPVPRP